MLIAEIEPRNNKPYLLKSRGVAYVRHGRNDFPANRLELDQRVARYNSYPIDTSVSLIIGRKQIKTKGGEKIGEESIF